MFAVDPSGGLLYTSSFGGSNTVSVWKIDSSTGGLTQLERAPTGPYPGSIAVCTADAEGALARVVGNNTYDGDQTVLGNMTANSFVGNGAGLTGVNAASLGGVSGTNYARLDTGNSFTGNQSINGSVAATGFSGNGSSLTNLSPANIAAGTAAINISGTAAAAVNATNSANLGGVASGNYARLDISNSFNGSQSITGDLSASGNVNASGNLSTSGMTTMGGGTPIVEHLSQTFTISVPAISPKNCAAIKTVTFPGAADGDTVALGVNNVLNSNGALIYFAWVSAADAVSIKTCDPVGPTNTAISGSIRVDVWKH